MKCFLTVKVVSLLCSYSISSTRPITRSGTTFRRSSVCTGRMESLNQRSVSIKVTTPSQDLRRDGSSERQNWRSFFLFSSQVSDLQTQPKTARGHAVFLSFLPSKATLSLETSHLLLCLLMLVFIKTQTLICNMSGFVAKTSEAVCCF